MKEQDSQPTGEITRMPDKETLQEFLRGMTSGHDVKVVFDREEGDFKWLTERPDSQLGQPKTEYGRSLKHS